VESSKWKEKALKTKAKAKKKKKRTVVRYQISGKTRERNSKNRKQKKHEINI